MNAFARLRPSTASVAPLPFWVVGVVASGFAYWFQNQLAPSITQSLWGTYILVPLVWLMAATASWEALRRTPDRAAEARPSLEMPLSAIAGLLAAFHVSLLMISGLLAGMGHSPYAHSFDWVIRNVLFFGAPIVAVEMARAGLIRRFGGGNLMPVLGLSAVAGTLIAISVTQLRGLDADKSTLLFVGSTILPLLAANLLAGFLCYLSGPRPAIVYRLAVEGFWILSPVLPDLQWVVLGFVGVAAPALGLWVLDGLVASAEGTEDEDLGKGVSPAWLVTAVLSLAMFFFAFGFFGIKPSFVPTHSMEPKINSGDIVFTRGVDASNVQVGDIVRYRVGNMDILHRVIGINPDGSFSTKGDNNNVADPQPVLREQIVGRYVGRVPKLGYVPIYFVRGISAVLP